MATSAGRLVDTGLDVSVVGGYTRLGLAVRRRLPGWPADPAPASLSGRTALVTGASSGLGEATAAGLARLGARVLLVVRDEEKGEQVRSELRAQVPGAALEVVRCDVGDLDDVRRFAGGLAVDRVDVLVHNAGAMPAERTESAQGHELTMAVHVLGPVLMTELLRDRLASAGRIVLVTSGGMYAQRLRADDPEYLESPYSGTTAYARSKRAQVELLPTLAERWRGQGASVAAMHPGWADTPGVVESLPLFHKVTGRVLRTAEEGADTTVWLAATDPQPQTGQLWHDRRPRPATWLGRRRTTPGDRERMWAFVREACGLGPEGR